MESVGVRELKQNASEVLARAERGETITITIQGRPVAQLSPITPVRRRWVPGAEMAKIVRDIGSDDTGWYDQWYASRDNDPLVDPWNDPAR